MPDGRLGIAVEVMPFRRSAVQSAQGPGLATLELHAQQLAEQVVVAEPFVVLVERVDEEVLASEPREQLVRVLFR